MGLRRVGLVGAVVLAGLGFVSSPASAAPPDPSGVVVGSTELAPGETFTVGVELYNPREFSIVGASAALRTVEAPISDYFELVSCTGTVRDCFALAPTVYRGPVGDLGPGESALVSYVLRVRDSVAGAVTLEHQLLGEEYSFAAAPGPVLTVVSPTADLVVSLDASPRGVLVSRITYTVVVGNNGPAAASGVRVAGRLAAGLSWRAGNGCVRVGTRDVQCDFASVPAGGSVSASFSADAGLLALGSFSTSVTRVASTPSDPVSGNDSARRTCTALTGLLVRC